MRTLPLLLSLCLLCGCSDVDPSSPPIGGFGGTGGDAGSGGGAAGAGGEGGAGGAESKYGVQLPCDDIVRGYAIREEWEYIQTTPGETFHLTRCDHYYIVDGVLIEEGSPPPGCTTSTKVADGDIFHLWCRELFHGPLRGFPDTGFEYYMEHGWHRYYLRRE
jgi:hypothetical protein